MTRIPVLTIAGSDSSGGAGIQADLKTMTVHGVYGMSVITALTAQNTTGVTAIQEASPDFLRQQIDAVFQDIPPQATKIGMVPSGPLVAVLAQALRDYQAPHVVLDPVMVSSVGSSLMKEDAVNQLIQDLLPLAQVVTPNISEAQVLAGMTIANKEDMVAAAKIIADRSHTAVLLKGGHRTQDADDLLYDQGQITWFPGVRVDNPNSHGTGCTLSSAIACNLAKGDPLATAIQKAKTYLTGALQAMLDLGAGSGPLDHAYAVCREEEEGQ